MEIADCNPLTFKDIYENWNVLEVYKYYSYYLSYYFVKNHNKKLDMKYEKMKNKLKG